jgi:hypothetical protein
MQTQLASVQEPRISTGCCPPFDPAPWQGKEVIWRDKPFLKTSMACLFNVPLNMGAKVAKSMALITAARAEVEQPLMLSVDRSYWSADLFIEVKGEVPGATVERLSGTFLTRVFEGPVANMEQWMAEMKSYVRAKGRALRQIYTGYTTCPRCAQIYGKSYVILLAQVEEPRS